MATAAAVVVMMAAIETQRSSKVEWRRRSRRTSEKKKKRTHTHTRIQERKPDRFLCCARWSFCLEDTREKQHATASARLTTIPCYNSVFPFRLTGDICMFSDHLLINCSMIMVISRNAPSSFLRSAIDDDQRRARARERM